MTQPVPQSQGRTLVARPGASLAQRGPLEIDYEPTDALGLELLPEPVRALLEDAGLVPESLFMECVDDAVTKRRRGGTYYQQVDAWWASLAQVHVATARRALESVGSGRFRPRGTWTVTGTSYALPPGLATERSVWHFEAPADGGPDTPKPKTDDPLDMLPGPLTQPLIGGEAQASRVRGDRWVKEEVIAYRLVAGRARLLVATRESTSLRKLSTTDWTAETLDAPVIATTPISLGPLPLTEGRGPGELGA